MVQLRKKYKRLWLYPGQRQLIRRWLVFPAVWLMLLHDVVRSLIFIRTLVMSANYIHRKNHLIFLAKPAKREIIFCLNWGSPKSAIYLMGDRTNWEKNLPPPIWSMDSSFWTATQSSKKLKEGAEEIYANRLRTSQKIDLTVVITILGRFWRMP